MFSIKTRTTIAALAAALSLAVAAGPASAARSMDYEPGTSGSHSFEPVNNIVAMDSGWWATGEEDGCQKEVDAANSWQFEGDKLAEEGDEQGAENAWNYASSIAGEANAEGCNIFLMEPPAVD